jgi:hypothetical protein
MVGRDDVILVRQGGDEMPEHVGTGRVSMQEKQHGRTHRPGFPVEHAETADCGDAVMDRNHN